jgi:hypothetical protein
MRCTALMAGQRKLVSEGSAIARALDYSLKRWEAFTRYLVEGHVPIDNNSMGTGHDSSRPAQARIGGN